MVTPILATKLFIPPPRQKIVLRPRLIERLNAGLSASCKLTLISAPAGFGKTTLVSEWIAGPWHRPPGQVCGRPVAWLSLDEGDNDPASFLTYLIMALQTISANIGAGALVVLQSPQPPPPEMILTALLNEITTIPDSFVLVLDDYQVIDSKPIDNALTFLLKHMPPQMHLVIGTREDPHLPLARLRARGQLTELRAADLRFTPSEAAEFLNQMMGLNLSEEDIAALETRTEGWIAGLQLAAISMQGHKDTNGFIQSFTGSHRFVMDYLLEEVFHQQSESIQFFLLRTSILDRMCGPLCDAVLLAPSASGQETLEYLEHANLFITTLDNERRWYRYHHLFAELLRQRLHQSASAGNEGGGVAEYHIRASIWYEANGLEIEAFQHAAAANDVERAEHLIGGKGQHLHYSGGAAILDWLESLSNTVLDTKPSLWVRYATELLLGGQTTGVEEKLQAAEAAIAASLQEAEPDDKTRDLIGQIAAARSSLALSQGQIETMITQSRRALKYLPPDNLLSRFRANWTMAMVYFLRGERAAAGRTNAEALSIALASGDIHNTILATTFLGQLQELENQLYPAAETYQRVLQLTGDYSPPIASDAYLGLAHICYEWNDLEAAEQHGHRSLQLVRKYDQVIDWFVINEVFLARVKLAQGDVAGAAGILAQADQSVRQHNFVHRISDVAAQQVIVLLHQGDLEAAAHLVQTHELPFSLARVHMAQGDTSSALAVLELLCQQMDAKGWQDEKLKVMVLQAVAHQAHGEKDKAMQLLGEALALAEPGGFIRLFVDEGEPMRLLILDFRLWIEKQAREGHKLIEYVNKLLAAFAQLVSVPQSEVSNTTPERSGDYSQKSTMVESLSQREVKILQLIAKGLSNREIGERLFLALSTVKGHNQKIFDKLQVQSRTEAVARARELDLL